MRTAQFLRPGNLWLLIAFVISLGHCAGAKTFVVTDTNDTTKITSLRGAIIAANNHGGNNTIILGQSSSDIWAGPQSWIYPLTLSLTVSNSAQNGSAVGELAITNGNLTIIGMHSRVTIDASNLDNRIFQIFPKAHLTLENLTLTGGNTASYEPGGQSGGAIWNEGTLEMDNCVLIGNSAGNAFNAVFGQPTFNGGDGGAIYNTGELTMYRCIVTENTCGAGTTYPASGAGANGGNGGGIYNSGEMTLDTCIISNNFCGQGANGNL